MVDFSIKKEDLVTPLLTVFGAIDRKQSLAVLSNIYLNASSSGISIKATDLEIEITAFIACEVFTTGIITIAAKKFVEIFRSLESNILTRCTLQNNHFLIKQAQSRFKIVTLPADNYPHTDTKTTEVEISLNKAKFAQILMSTQFAMAQQDVRFYLNGLLLEFEGKNLNVVASDGHRMAINSISAIENFNNSFLLPRRGISELLRLLNNIDDADITLSAASNHFMVKTRQFCYLTKLIDAKFPPYKKAIPTQNNKAITLSVEKLRACLNRIIILAHEKSRGILFSFSDKNIILQANNQNLEEAQESLEGTNTSGDALKTGINATYLLDVLQYLGSGDITLQMSHPEASILITSSLYENFKYILMPMKI